MRYNTEWFKKRMEKIFPLNKKSIREYEDRFTDEYNVLMIKVHNEEMKKEVFGRNGLYINPISAEHITVTYDSISRAIKTMNLYIKRYKIRKPMVVMSIAGKNPPALTLTDEKENKYITIFIAPSYVQPKTDYIYDKEVVE